MESLIYHSNKTNAIKAIKEVNTITSEMITCKTLDHFQVLVETHEDIISKITNQLPVKKRLFNDFNGSIKSLGAWGGDFVLAISKNNPTAYFEAKGYTTILLYKDMIL